MVPAHWLVVKTMHYIPLNRLATNRVKQLRQKLINHKAESIPEKNLEIRVMRRRWWIIAHEFLRK